MSIMRYLMAKVDKAIQRAMYPEEFDETSGTNALETRSSNSEEMEYEGVSLPSSLLELDRVHKDRSGDQELVIYWLPLEACLVRTFSGFRARGIVPFCHFARCYFRR